MSLYKEYETTAKVYHSIDNPTTQKYSRGPTESFTIKMFIHKRAADDMAVLGVDTGDYVADVNCEYTNSDKIVKGDKIVCDSKAYIVVSDPLHMKLHNRYKILLKSSSGRT